MKHPKIDKIKPPSIAKNFLYNAFYQLSLIILPFVTVPYVTRVLGSEGVGIYAFTDSIVQYFILFGTIGIILYGNRAIAYTRDNITDRSRTFWEINIYKFILTIIAIIVFLLFAYFYDEKYRLYFYLQTFMLIGAFFDISWFFMGIEDFKKTVTRNMIVRFIGIALIFTLVKEKQDLWIYILILTLSQCLGNLVMWAYIPKLIIFTKVGLKSTLKHFQSAMMLFVPQIAIQIYILMDKTLLGIFTTESEVGYYEAAIRIVRLLLVLVVSIGTVMLPRISNHFAKGEIDKVKEFSTKSFMFTSYLAFPLTLGLVSISSFFVPWFLGEDFAKTAIILPLLSPIIIAISWGTVLGAQLMVPIKKEKLFTVIVSCGAVVSLILNFILIPRFQSVGASITAVSTELFVATCMLFAMKSYIDTREIFSETWKYLLAALLMFFVINTVVIFEAIPALSFLTKIFIAHITYVGTLFILKSSMNVYVHRKVFDKVPVIKNIFR